MRRIGDLFYETEWYAIQYPTLAFSGLRPQKMPFSMDAPSHNLELLRATVNNRIIWHIENSGTKVFLCGMALGVDSMCSELVLELKAQYPDIKLHAIIPCRNQDVKWREHDKIRYRELLSQCDEVYCHSEEYTSTCMIERNFYMINHCDLLLAVWTGTPGGTAKTVKYAEANKVTTEIINPNDFK